MLDTMPDTMLESNPVLSAVFCPLSPLHQKGNNVLSCAGSVLSILVFITMYVHHNIYNANIYNTNKMATPKSYLILSFKSTWRDHQWRLLPCWTCHHYHHCHQTGHSCYHCTDERVQLKVEELERMMHVLHMFAFSTGLKKQRTAWHWGIMMQMHMKWCIIVIFSRNIWSCKPDFGKPLSEEEIIIGFIIRKSTRFLHGNADAVTSKHFSARKKCNTAKTHCAWILGNKKQYLTSKGAAQLMAATHECKKVMTIRPGQHRK